MAAHTTSIITKMLDDNLPVSLATATGHTDLNRQSSRHRANPNAAVVTASTYVQETADHCATDDEGELSDVDESHESTAAYITMMPIEPLDINHSDFASGAFPLPIHQGKLLSPPCIRPSWLYSPSRTNELQKWSKLRPGLSSNIGLLCQAWTPSHDAESRQRN
jgi:hypothetical protein